MALPLRESDPGLVTVLEAQAEQLLQQVPVLGLHLLVGLWHALATIPVLQCPYAVL